MTANGVVFLQPPDWAHPPQASESPKWDDVWRLACGIARLDWDVSLVGGSGASASLSAPCRMRVIDVFGSTWDDQTNGAFTETHWYGYYHQMMKSLTDESCIVVSNAVLAVLVRLSRPNSGLLWIQLPGHENEYIKAIKDDIQTLGSKSVCLSLAAPFAVEDVHRCLRALQWLKRPKLDWRAP